jgi:hypothetical protein
MRRGHPGHIAPGIEGGVHVGEVEPLGGSCHELAPLAVELISVVWGERGTDAGRRRGRERRTARTGRTCSFSGHATSVEAVGVSGLSDIPAARHVFLEADLDVLRERLRARTAAPGDAEMSGQPAFEWA